MREIKVILPLIAIFAVAVISTFQIGGASARGSHVEYVVPPQSGINVVQRGQHGLVEVEVTRCLIAGEPFTFDMTVFGDREGDSDLTVRKNSGVDISSWFSLNPSKVPLPGETTVVVTVTPPVGTTLDVQAVARIQEVGNPPAPGGHHGVKVVVTCVGALTPPVVLPPEEVTPTPTIGVPEETPTPAPAPEVPKAFPPTGSEPPEDNGSTGQELISFGTAAVIIGLGMFLEAKRRRLF